MSRDFAVPFVGGIIERIHQGKRQLLIQTRSKPHDESIYNGTLEFAAGALDKLYENIYDTLAREIKEETGLVLKRVIDDNQTDKLSPQKVDEVFGFRPFCCTQQLREGRPWIGFIFRCEVEDGTPTAQAGETEDVHWEDYTVVKKMFEESPEKFFTLEVPAWSYYFKEVRAERE
jgi:8-oxo-dGTP pyrophosphatase MutT (NUDIX family)